MSNKILSIQNPNDFENPETIIKENEIKEKYTNISKIHELNLDIKNKNIEINELKTKYREQKKLLKFFLNNVDNLENLLEIKKQLDEKDEIIEKIKNELSEEKIKTEKNILQISEQEKEIISLKESLEKYEGDVQNKNDINSYETTINKKD